MQCVYILDRDGHPLMSTTRYGKVRRMLDDNRTVAVSTKPFAIRLTYEPMVTSTQQWTPYRTGNVCCVVDR